MGVVFVALLALAITLASSGSSRGEASSGRRAPARKIIAATITAAAVGGAAAKAVVTPAVPASKALFDAGAALGDAATPSPSPSPSTSLPSASSEPSSPGEPSYREDFWYDSRVSKILDAAPDARSKAILVKAMARADSVTPPASAFHTPLGYHVDDPALELTDEAAEKAAACAARAAEWATDSADTTLPAPKCNGFVSSLSGR